jgi:predicted Zn-ribbon and HTH transcriptional regulator
MSSDDKAGFTDNEDDSEGSFRCPGCGSEMAGEQAFISKEYNEKSNNPGEW